MKEKDLQHRIRFARETSGADSVLNFARHF